MNRVLKFIRDDHACWKYYDAVYILFHTGLRISEFCVLILPDIDLVNNIIIIDHQLLRNSNSNKYLQTTKTNAGTRKLPIKEDAAEKVKRIENLEKARKEMNGEEKEKPMKQNMFKAI